MLDQLTLESFEPHVGSTFEVSGPDGRKFPFELVRVGKVMESEAARLKRNAFSLYFYGPPSPILPQSIYDVSHTLFGAEPLGVFLVPVGRDARGVQYEAVFT